MELQRELATRLSQHARKLSACLMSKCDGRRLLNVLKLAENAAREDLATWSILVDDAPRLESILTKFTRIEVCEHLSKSGRPVKPNTIGKWLRERGIPHDKRELLDALVDSVGGMGVVSAKNEVQFAELMFLTARLENHFDPVISVGIGLHGELDKFNDVVSNIIGSELHEKFEYDCSNEGNIQCFVPKDLCLNEMVETWGPCDALARAAVFQRWLAMILQYFAYKEIPPTVSFVHTRKPR